MMDYLLNLDKKLLEITKAVGQEADSKNIRAYLVGGIVRDLILGRKIFDLDIVIEGDAIPFTWDLSRTLGGKATVYPNFGTATLRLESGCVIDIATARKERYIAPGALPIVSPGILKDDLFRRDFTINAVVISINRATWGNIIDEFRGMEDLKKKRLVVFHEKSFLDDPTRMLRLVRFEQRFSFEIDKGTLKLFKAALKGKCYQTVKPQRYFAEFKKILKEEDPVPCLKRLDEFKLLNFIKKPFSLRLQSVNKVHKGIISLKKKEEFKDFDGWWMIYLIDLVAGLDNKNFNSFIEKVHLSNDEKAPLVQSRNFKETIKKISLRRISKSAIFRVLTGLKKEAVIYLTIRSNSNVVKKRINDFFVKSRSVKISLDGDFLKRKGIESGEMIGKLLDALLDAKIDGKVRNRREEESMVKKLVLKMNKEKLKGKSKK